MDKPQTAPQVGWCDAHLAPMKMMKLYNYKGEVVGEKLTCRECEQEEGRKLGSGNPWPSRAWRDKNVCTRKD